MGLKQRTLQLDFVTGQFVGAAMYLGKIVDLKSVSRTHFPYTAVLL